MAGYVYESKGKIQGFVGLNGEYMEGIFVCDKLQSQGIGKLLLDFVKKSRTELSLNVYQKNARVIYFYQREGFVLKRMKSRICLHCLMDAALGGKHKRLNIGI